MDCTLIRGDLIAYHFAAASDEARERVESHLMVCTTCLRSYLALKAHVDRTGHASVQPSEASRLKLRAAVEVRFRPTRVGRVRRWLSRPVPLYQGLALAAVVVLGVALAPALTHRLTGSRVADASGRVDTSRTTAESVSIY
jgi:predicted anti-sigma-YlaC factor YlaD